MTPGAPYDAVGAQITLQELFDKDKVLDDNTYPHNLPQPAVDWLSREPQRRITATTFLLHNT